MSKAVQINSSEIAPFNEQLHKLAEDKYSKLHLKVFKILTDEEIEQLGEFIVNQKPFPYTKLTLKADINALKNPKFLETLQKLNSTLISGVELIFTTEELKQSHAEILDALTYNIAPKILYPIQIREYNEEKIVPSHMDLQDFQNIVIGNMQKRNNEGLEFSTLDESTKAYKRIIDPKDPINKKIKLKDLVRRKNLSSEDITHYIPLEVQHVETMEQEIALQQQEIVEIEAHVELHEIQEYGGQLLGFEDFSAPLYKSKVAELTHDEALTQSLYELLQHELFANLPHAIKFISPDAAEQLALNLPSFVTLNKDNLPNGFILKQTKSGELVLDFDPYLENEQSNPFTPVEFDIEPEPIYDIEFKEQDVNAWIDDEQLTHVLCPTNCPYTTPKQLINLWIKYGNKGVTAFFNDIKAATKSNPELASFLLSNYLVHLPQWDHLYNNQNFFNSIERASHYDEQKLFCFKKFLQDTGTSRHNLIKTVEAFETFWNELNILCSEQKISISGINQSNWSTPKGGNPVVSMERMLLILKNARSLKDQFKLLNDVTLINYGAYYASRFEGFKAVSAEMALKYDVAKQKLLPFSKDFNLYRVELDSLSEPFARSREYQDLSYRAGYSAKEEDNSFWLVNCEKELPQPLTFELLKNEGLVIPFYRKKFVPPYQFYHRKSDGSMELLYAEKPKTLSSEEYIASSFRFIGIQKTGITVSSLREQFAKFQEQYMSWVDLSAELLATLFFVSNERYIENQPLHSLLRSLNHSSIHKEVINNAINLLNKLYKLDIKLNQAEGLMLFESIAGMNSAEFEGLRISKEECITKLLKQLEGNKFAAFKFFDFRTKKSSPKWPFLYALDTAEYLAKDPIIAATYHDDLLLFSGLINSISKEVYYHARLNPPKNEETSRRRRATKIDNYAELVKGNLEKVQYYLHQAATKEKPNNLQYAIQVMINTKNYFTYADFLAACAEIELLDRFDSNKVDEILRRYKFAASAELPELFTKDNADLKGIMISLIVQLENVKTKPNKKDSESPEQTTQEVPLDEEGAALSKLHEELSSLSIAELQVRLKRSWNEAGTLLSISGKIFLNQILKTTKDLAIKSAFNLPDAKGLLKVVGEKIEDLSDFQDHGDFEKVNRIANEAEKIAALLSEILKNSFVIEHEQELVGFFQRINFSKFDYEILYGVLFLLTTMPQRNYLQLLNTIFADERFIGNKERVVELLNLLTALNNSYFPSEYLDAFSKLVIANPGQKEFNLIMSQMVKIYDNDNKDPILELILSHSELTYKQVIHMLSISEGIDKHRDKVGNFLIHLVRTQKLESFLKQIADIEPDVQKKIMEILSQGHALNRATVEYEELATFLTQLSKNELKLLATFYQTTPVSAESLVTALTKLQFKKPDNFQNFLFEFEKAPFGERNFKNQFSTTEVERVINQSSDFINKTPYTYHYRKQLLESFLFVNEIGEKLPVYYNKPAKDLTNAEIKAYFADLKAKKISGLTPFQSRLMALGLMREAMYRSTGEFPYSTQVIALIDGMMHPGDFISNIDTGQGKSLVDSMKAALLWLDSDRVDLTTSSFVDAKRDIANYGAFLKLLDIPYSESPISSASPIEAFQKNGINFSTFAQLSLFFAKVKVIGKKLDNPDTVVSLVANESDYTILDDRVIYRFATADGSGISYGQEWIYHAFNEFVTRKEFIENKHSTAQDDISDLKAYLEIKAKEIKKSGKIVNKFSDAQYLVWLESAITVNYVLKENDDYVIPDEFEKKIINGTELRSKVVKVLMKDDKVSPDSTFGNGIQQLLYARLNKERGSNDFVIEPQNKTIISTNNKNLIDYYRARKGFIWGSSGTIGSDAEIQEQYAKYGFDFSKGEPHQKNRVKFKAPIIEADENAQFNKLISLLTADVAHEGALPGLVFCKDINTATRLFKELEKRNPKNFPLQLYTGLGKEEDYIKNAGKPGMITITTSALGRNTNINYDRIKGLRVWHTFVDSVRGMGQKSGRTGRQGSAGEVNFVFNAQELGKKTVKQIQDEIDQFVALERSVNEELYNVLGYLLTKVDLLIEEKFVKGKSAFLRESWAQFSTDTEALFRESRREVVYDKEAFIKKTLASFNSILNAAVKTPVEEVTLENLSQTIEQSHPEKVKYKPYNNEVKLGDCTPPITIAYHLLQFAHEEKQPKETKKAVKAKISQIFERMQKNPFAADNNEYLAYLVSHPTTQEVVVEAHKEFLTQYLQDHSKKLNIVQRWLGYEGKLNQIASNQNYLLMFHAFASIPNKPVIELNVIQKAINTLLDEYLETSWFISSERRTWAMKLKSSINEATDINEVIRYLSQAQVEVAKQDIETNKQRGLKPLHLFGHSRYQTTLNRALNLAASLSGKTDVDEVAKGLIPLMAEVTDKSPVTDLTLDELKHRAKSKKSDKSNAAVIINTLENALSIKERKGPEGMIGRKGFFNQPQEDNTTQPETDESHHNSEQGKNL